MNTHKLKTHIFLALIMCILLALTLTSATFAWFSANRQVGTSRAAARTATGEISLLVSSKGGSEFDGSDEADIVQVNTSNMKYLMPVSTADLQSFVCCPATSEDGNAVSFNKVENEENYFHGRIYIKAVLTGINQDSSVAVYLDESELSGGELVQPEDSDSLILNAARLGLTFNHDETTSVIFRLSDQSNPDGARRNNTVLNGRVLGDGFVLSSSGSDISAVEDPAVPFSDYTVDESGDRLPEKPLFIMEANTIYPVDVFFYLEGCDPDCTEAISFDANDLHLAFYGVIS